MKTGKKTILKIVSAVIVIGVVASESSITFTPCALADGEKTTKISCTFETKDIKEYEILPKTIYDEGETTVKVINCEMEFTIQYKETKYYDFETYNLPKDATVHVYHNGEDKGEGTYIGIYNPTEDYTVEAKVLDKDGNEIASSGVIKVKVKNGVFDRLKVSVKDKVKTVIDGVLDVVSAILLNIWLILRGGNR